ncbi:glycoside hydrolase family 31 protein [Clostridium sp. YIM B02515]|uniref:Glycoside hydrolase family 31 protein n=1 Tax=Clostridium rhizosphaerae TaxID=2803861 RepID=A0ABS1T9Q2_9CLOT|nr:glycoside hydrolase family 31 protein [Clostridium rhizosphaerae]
MFGKTIRFILEENKVIFNFENGQGWIEIINPWIINVFSPLKYDNHYSRAIEGVSAEKCNFEVNETDKFIEIKTEQVSVRVSDNFYVDFYDKNGEPICLDYKGDREPFVRRGNVSIAEAEGHRVETNADSHKIEVVKKMFGDENFYGFGDKTGHLNKRNYSYEMWNTDDPSPHVESYKSLYKSIPFFVTLNKGKAFGIFFDNTFKTYFDMGKENSDYYYFGAEDGNLDYYFIAGPDFKDVIGRYTYLTGKTPMPQLWTLGYHQCRWSYAPEGRLKEVAKAFRDNDIPCDALYLDIDYMDGFRVFTWDKERFPNPKETLTKLREEGFKVVTIIDPGVKKDKGYSIYEEGLKNNYFATDKDGVPYVNAVWPGDSLYPDFSEARVREWWSDNQKIMMEDGVAGIWNDMNEPASFNGPLPDDVQFGNDGRPTDHREVHNVYGHLMSKSSYEGIKKHTEKRPFVITRACYAGTQKYSTVWTGDNQSLWEHLRMSVPMLLNLGLSGLSFAGTDVGGFGFDCTGELLSRWIQVGCFSPLFRNHSSIHTRDQEPWAFDKQTLDINKKYIKLRYKLLPYLYDLMWQGERTGLPVMRPLVLHYSQDEQTYNINDEFLFGENILVAPVVEQGKSFKAVYLPEGEWIDFWTGQTHKGKDTILKNAPLDTCPIYIKAGSIIPSYPEQKYIGEKVIDELTLNIYPGKSEYIHYEDDGESFDYKKGKYNLYKFTMENNKNITIGLNFLNEGYSKKYKNFRFIINNVKARQICFNGESINFNISNGSTEFVLKAEEGKLNII